MNSFARSFQRIFAFVIFAVAGPAVAHADIVFVNLNNATQEISALRALGEQTHERVFILPDANSQYVIDDGPTKNKLYQTPQLTEDLIRLAKAGVRPRAMVFSGHHVENQYFYGSVGSVFVHNIPENLAKYPGSPEVTAFFSGITSLYLWGCYSGTFSNTLKLVNFQESPFSNLKIIFGFLKKGPLGTSVVSGNLLREAVGRSEQILQFGQNQSKLATLKKIMASSKYDLIAYQGDVVFTKTSAATKADILRACQAPSTLRMMSETMPLVLQYDDGLLPIPVNTSESPLRSAYHRLQEFNYCWQLNLVPESIAKRAIPIDSVVSLIFYRNIVTNFARLYASQLRGVSERLAKYGIEHADIYTRLPQIERGELIKLHDDVNKQIIKKFSVNGEPQSETDEAKMIYLQNLIKEITYVIHPNEDFVPEEWKEENAIYGSPATEILGAPLDNAWTTAYKQAHCIWYTCDGN
jgi:hypothetical protein